MENLISVQIFSNNNNLQKLITLLGEEKNLVNGFSEEKKNKNENNL